MDLNDFIKSLKHKRKVFWIIVVLVFLMSFVVTILQPLKFGSESQVLVSQKVEPGTDVYTISKSNEYLSSSLAKVISSNAFFNDTMDSDSEIDKSYFSTDLKGQIEMWRKTVEANTLSDSGIIVINVYHTDRYQAEQIARAINNTLKTKGSNYFNSGTGLYVRVLDEPIVSTWPVKPNILVNLLSGLLLGFSLGLFYVYIITNENEELVSILPDFKLRDIETDDIPHVVSIPKATKVEPIQTKVNTEDAVPNVIAPPVNVDKQFNDLIKQADINNVF
ncbi:MAG: Wzz/FepE/Etk N-terminal domain-containing protein [bacterium]